MKKYKQIPQLPTITLKPFNHGMFKLIVEGSIESGQGGFERVLSARGAESVRELISPYRLDELTPLSVIIFYGNAQLTGAMVTLRSESGEYKPLSIIIDPDGDVEPLCNELIKLHDMQFELLERNQMLEGILGKRES